MYFILFKAHSGLRWLLVLAVLLLLARLYILVMKKSGFAKNDEILLKFTTILMDVQLLIGLVMLLWDGFKKSFFPLYRIEHGVTLLVASVLAHLPARWKALPAPERAKKTLYAYAASAFLVVVGITRLPQGW